MGIICACSLIFPAFLERHGPDLISVFRSYTSPRKVVKVVSSNSTRTIGGQGNRLENITLDVNEYSKLNGDGSATKMQEVTIGQNILSLT